MKFTISTLVALILTAQPDFAADYAELQNKLIAFYGYQRAGTKGGNPHNPFYTRTPYPHAQDNYNGKDLSGGWYDAGDFVKFGLPLGWTVYCLLKGYDVFPRGYDDKDSWAYTGNSDGIPDILGEAKIGTDYLIKAVLSDGKIVRDVGDGFQDHQQWVSGYNSSAARTVYTTTKSDIAGLYAAALALMSMLYEQHDASYAATCLTKAKEAFKYGLLNQGISDQQRDPNLGNVPYYSTSTYKDKMACAAVELYRATGEETYLDWAKNFMAELSRHYFVVGYANSGDIAAFEMYRIGEKSYISSWLSDVNLTLNRVVTSNNASCRLVKGAFVNSDWGVAGNAGNAAFSAALAFMVKGDQRYKDFAFQQINWLAGFSPYTKSYVVRYNGGPANPHHRNDNTLPVNLVGGIVSGPTPQGFFDPNSPESSNWTFTDSKDIYKNTEVALDYNSGAIGALAFIRDYQNPPAKLIRISQAVAASPDIADLNKSGVTITATFDKAVDWRIVLTGRKSSAQKTYTGSGKSISLDWNGESNGTDFVTGEYVDIKLDMPDIASYHQSLARANFFLSANVKQQPKATDVLIDDFNDKNATNNLQGVWSVFSDKAVGGKSYTSPPALGATSFTQNGESGTNALVVRMIGRDGADHPFAGVKTSFSKNGGVTSLGNARSVFFDIRTSSTNGGVMVVELEQDNITDGAYFGHEAVLSNDKWIRLRLSFDNFKQPDWKTVSKSLALDKVISLRFTYYGSDNLQIILDNVYIEELDIGGVAVRKSVPLFSSPTKEGLSITDVSNGSISYFIESEEHLRQTRAYVQIFDMNGKRIFGRIIPRYAPRTELILTDVVLAPGLYYLKHSQLKQVFSKIFMKTR
ncbi:MAG: hypothetical protein GF398_00520 [Chitinivibrionales bacterium]|nr:hypothetical protein [Chitinivibrionales bacterium]